MSNSFSSVEDAKPEPSVNTVNWFFMLVPLTAVQKSPNIHLENLQMPSQLPQLSEIFYLPSPPLQGAGGKQIQDH